MAWMVKLCQRDDGGVGVRNIVHARSPLAQLDQGVVEEEGRTFVQ
jgi:hypothetical protein